MTFAAFSLTLFIAAAGLTSPVDDDILVRTRTLTTEGLRLPQRLAGPTASRDFFFPLASRDFVADASSFSISLERSPLADPASIITVLVNDRAATTAIIGDSEKLVIPVPMPPDARGDDPATQVVKLTVQTTLEPLDEALLRSPSLARAGLWVDVLPETSWNCAVSPDDPDWLAVGRLPATLGPAIAIEHPGTDLLSQELALRAVTWAIFCQPAAELDVLEPGGSADFVGDVLCVDTSEAAEPGIRIEATAGGRRITFSAASAADLDRLWALLESKALTAVPDSIALATGDAEASATSAGPTQVRLADLNPDLTDATTGRGTSHRSFFFPLGAFGEGAGDLEIRLTGQTSPLPGNLPMQAAIFLNGNYLSAISLNGDGGEFDVSVALPQRHLRGENEVRISLTPDDEVTSYVWQLDATTQIISAPGGPVTATAPEGLLEAAQRHFARGEYDVMLDDAAAWETAVDLAIWLQRVNRSTLLAPQLTADPMGDHPLVVIGNLPAPLASAADSLPIQVIDGTIVIGGDDRGTALQLGPDSSAGYWQLGFLTNETPIIAAGALGPDGAATLAAVSRQMAATRWIEAGDVVIGDGRSPVLTLTTRGAPLAIEPGTATATGSLELAPASTAGLSGDWRQWRWWIIGSLWLGLSGFILWVYQQGRRRVR